MTFGKAGKSNVLQISRITHNLSNDVFIRNKIINKNNYLDDDYPWSIILEATSLVVQIVYHTKLQTTPGKLVFGHEIILNIPAIFDW